VGPGGRIVPFGAVRRREPRHAVAPGSVHLVGAGPGNPDLLTVRALRLIQGADVIVFDKLVSAEIMALAPAAAERIHVGKSRVDHTMSQDEINKLLVARARRGERVVRLKGGDPFVFGRGGEELEAVRAAGIPVEVVPGITAAIGCAAAAQIPLSHRDLAQSVTFVSGHAKAGAPDHDWEALARADRTLVVYMGVATAGTVAERLIAHGLDPATPAAVIENGTRPEQMVVTGTVAGLARLITDHGITGPALLIIGGVAALAADAGTQPALLARLAAAS